MNDLKEYANEVPSAKFDVRVLESYLTGLAQVQTESWWNDAEKWAEDQAKNTAESLAGDAATSAIDAGVNAISAGINAIGNSLASSAEEGIELAQVQTQSWWDDAEKWAENEAEKEAK